MLYTIGKNNRTADKEIIDGIQKLQLKLNNTHTMPTSVEMTDNGFGWLRSRISRSGGMTKWSEKLGVPLKRPQEAITDEMVEEEIREVMRLLGLNRMPTSDEIKSLDKGILIGRIDRSYGFLGWAQRLGVKLKSQITSPHKDLSDEEAISKGIEEVQILLGIDRMPTDAEIKAVSMGWLASRIQRAGGLVLWASKLGLPLKRENNKPMSKVEIEEQIYKAVKFLDIDTMPTSSDLKLVENGVRLHNSIVNTLGYRGWANKLNLDSRHSETKIGLDSEDDIANILAKKGYNVKKMATNHPFDLLIDDSVKIDVKTANARIDNKGHRTHTFATGKRYGSCDLYICVALSEESEIEKLLVIPSHHLQIVTLCIGNKSSYDIYNKRFDLINEYSKFFKSIKGE